MIKKILITAIAIAMAVSNIGASSSQSNTQITGIVTDAESNEPLVGCLVRINGDASAAVTDIDGKFSFSSLAPAKYTLEATYTGFTPIKTLVSTEDATSTEVVLAMNADAFMLEQVVVTSSKSEIVRRESPALVNVLPAKIFNRVGAASLADGLDFQPGVRVENDCQNCGFTQVRINGLDGHYSQILVNSRPVFSALAGVYGLEHIPANMIDRVEVMRGGGSALFGSSAVGGTINIITKDPTENSAEVSHSLRSVGISGSLENTTNFNASVVTPDDKAGIFLYGQSRDRDGYDHNDDGFTEICEIKSQTIGARSFLRTSDASRLSIEYHHTHEYRRGGDNLENPPHMAMIAEQAEHNINSAEITYDIWPRDHRDHVAIFAATQATRRKSYYGSDMDPDAYGRTSDVVATAGSQWTHPFERLVFMPSELVAGLEYSYNRLHDITVGYDHNLLQTVNIYSAYLQNEWRDSRWGFLVGARVDKHSLIDNAIISPRVNLRFNPSKEYNFRVSYSTGFRAPQTYDEDLHVAIVGGDRVVSVLAPDLKQEKSQSISASADLYHRFGNVQTNLLVEGFYTDLADVFTFRQVGSDELGNAVLERYNGSGARVLGVNIEAKAFFSSHFDVQAGVTLQRSRYKQPEYWSENPDVPAEKRLFRTPDAYGYFTANWEVFRGIKAAFSGTLTGPMTVQHIEGSGTPIDVAVRTSTFFDASLMLTYCINVYKHFDLDINAGITNIFNSYQNDFDCGSLRDSGYVYGPTAPRSLTVGFKFSI